MLPEQFDQDPGGPLDADTGEYTPHHGFVGAPTEYADEQEVPETVSFLAKVFAGGVLTTTYLASIVVLVIIGCVACFILLAVAGSLFG